MSDPESVVEKISKYLSLIILGGAIFFASYLGEYAIGYTILIAGALSLYLAEAAVARNLLLLYIASSLLLAIGALDSLGQLSNWLTATLGVFSVALPIIIASLIYKPADVKSYFLNNHAGFKPSLWRLIILVVLAAAIWMLVSFKQ